MRSGCNEGRLGEGVRDMRDWSLEHLGNAALLRDLKTLAAQDCVHLAKLLAHIAEVDARQLWRGPVKWCVNGSGGVLLGRFRDSHPVDVVDSSIDFRSQVSGVQLTEVFLSDEKQAPDERGCVLGLLEAL